MRDSSETSYQPSHTMWSQEQESRMKPLNVVKRMPRYEGMILCDTSRSARWHRPHGQGRRHGSSARGGRREGKSGYRAWQLASAPLRRKGARQTSRRPSQPTTAWRLLRRVVGCLGRARPPGAVSPGGSRLFPLRLLPNSSQLGNPALGDCPKPYGMENGLQGGILDQTACQPRCLCQQVAKASFH